MDKKQKSILLLSIFTISLLFLFNLNNSLALQDNDDLETTISAHLDSDSAELIGGLMTLGTYDYYNTPEWDVGLFDHDLTQIQVSRIQTTITNTTDAESHIFSNGVNATEGNHSLEFNTKIPQYQISNGLDTRISVNYSYIASNWENTILFQDNLSGSDWNFYDVNENLKTLRTNEHNGEPFTSTLPSNWEDVSNSPSSWGIASEIDGHKNVAWGEDLGASSQTFRMNIPLDASHVTGIVEMWIRVDSINDFRIQLKDNNLGYGAYSLGHTSGNFEQYPHVLVKAGALANTWYHWKIIWDCTSDTYDWYIDGVLEANDLSFHQDLNVIDCILFKGGQEMNYNGYFDGFGVVGEKSYEEGDNLLTTDLHVQPESTNYYELVRNEFSENYIRRGDYFLIDLKTNNDHEINFVLLANDVVQKEVEIIPEGNSNFNRQLLNITLNESITFDQIKFTGSFTEDKYLKLYNNISLWGYPNDNIFDNIYTQNFTYQILGVDYTESFNMLFDSDKSNYYDNIGNYVYYFDSSMFDNYNYSNNVLILNQGFNFTLDLSRNLDCNLTSNINVSYTSNTWKLPSEANLKINSEDVVDSSLNSGIVYLYDYPSTLTIIGDIDVYFELDLITNFNFKFDLDIITKSYLKKTFKLLSDHSISLERIDFPTALDIKKIYLNSEDLGNDNPNLLSPEVEMNTNNIFSLEIILVDEIYIPLEYIHGTGATETLYNEGFYIETSEMAHSSYIDSHNSTYDFNNYELNMENQFPSEYHEENWNDWTSTNNSDYTETSHGNGNFSSELNTYNNSIIPEQPSDFTFTNGTFNNTYGDLNNIDGNFTTFNSTEYVASGTYPATYSFTDDTTGGNPAGWNVIETGGTVNIIASLSGHDKVVELHDTSGTNDVKMEDTFSAQTTGTVEYWIRTSNNNKEHSYIIGDSNKGYNNQIFFYLASDGWMKYYDGADHNIMLYSANVWYRVKIEFDCATDWHLWINGTSKDGGSGYTFRDNPDAMDKTDFRTKSTDQTYYYYVDAVGYSWDPNYDIGDNENPLATNPPTINFTINMQLDTTKVYSNETIDFISLEYSYNTSISSQQVNFSIWDYSNSKWHYINTSAVNDNFHALNFVLNYSLYNTSYHILLKFESIKSSSDFQLNLEMLRMDYNWTKTSGNIYSYFEKDILYSFLNLYDSFSKYQKLYNISLNFRYFFTNYTSYNSSVNLTLESIEYNLTINSLNIFNIDFVFNSESRNNFTILFNATNGLLEVSEMNYTINFNCLDVNSKTRLYQHFKIEPNLSLDYYEQTEGTISINFIYTFTQGSFDFNYANNSMLYFIIYIQTEDNWINISYDYNYSRSETFTIQVSEIISNNSKTEFRDFHLEIFLSGNSSQITFDDLYLLNELSKIQVDKSPRTDSNSVDFIEYLIASRSFSYWYFENSLTINDVSLTQRRTSTTIDSFEINNSRYYFQESIQENDIFSSNVDYNPNWNFSYEIVENTGVYSKIKVKYYADLVVRNVTLILDLSECYNDNWTLNAEQNSNTLKLEIPGLDFSTIEKSFYIEGYSDTPSAKISSYESDQNWNQIAEDTEITFAGFIQYPKYTNTFLLSVEKDWTCYDIYYGNKTYSTKRLSSSSIYVVGTGFDKSVNNSYLHFTTKPFKTADWNYENDTITITIESSLPVGKTFFKYAFNPSGVHDLKVLESNIEIDDLSDSETHDYLTFNCDLIPKGKTIIKIHVNFATPLEVFIQMLFPLLTVVGFIGAYYYFKNNEAAAEKIQKFVNEKIIEKVEKKLGKGGYEELHLYTDETNKVHFKKKEEVKD